MLICGFFLVATLMSTPNISKPLDEYAFANCDGTAGFVKATAEESNNAAGGPVGTGVVSFPESRRDFVSGGCMGEVIDADCAAMTGCDTPSGLGAVGVLCNLFCSSGVPDTADEVRLADGGCIIEFAVFIGEF